MKKRTEIQIHNHSLETMAGINYWPSDRAYLLKKWWVVAKGQFLMLKTYQNKE